MQRVSGHREWRWSSRFVRFVSDHLQDRTASRILLQQCSGHENASFSKMWLDYIAKLSVLERISVVCVCVCVGFTWKGFKDVRHFIFFAGTIMLGCGQRCPRATDWTGLSGCGILPERLNTFSGDCILEVTGSSLGWLTAYVDWSSWLPQIPAQAGIIRLPNATFQIVPSPSVINWYSYSIVISSTSLLMVPFSCCIT